MTNNPLLNSQIKSYLDETVTEPSDLYCFKSNYIKPNQFLIFSKWPKKSLISMKLSQNLQMGVVSNKTKPTLNHL